jgi:aminoglycoside 6-adenylyltransferase
MSWHIGSEQGFSFSLGKNYKFIERYLPEQDWQKLLSTYSENSYENMWQSLFTCHELFRKYAKAVSKNLGYPYPNYDEVITKYTEEIYHSLN